MRICYVLAYRAPDYIRTRSLLAALHGLPGIECHTAINRVTSWPRYRDTLAQVRTLRDRFEPDLYLLGFRGHELYWPLRRLIGRTPLILDAMMSPTLSLAEEDQYGRAGRFAAALLGPVERRILHDADGILTDTAEHVAAMSRHFGLSADRFAALPVGAVETTHRPDRPGHTERLRVLFYGSFLPLHGANVILEACRLSHDLPCDLDLIGAPAPFVRQLQQTLPASARLRYRTRSWVPFEQLVNQELPGSDLCLGGPFGNTPQAQRVITGKTSQALALGVPTVVGDNPAHHGFQHQHNCLRVEQGNPHALAAALRWACEHRSALPALGEAGRTLYQQHLSLAVIRQRLATIMARFQA